MSEAMSLGETYIKVRGDLSQLPADLAQVKSMMMGGISSIHSTIAGAAAGLVAAGMGLGASAFVQKAAEMEDSSKRLEAIVKGTGHAAGLTATQLEDMASALSSTSRFSAGALKDVMSTLLTHQNIKGDQFEGAVKAAMDVASAGRIGLEGAAHTIAMAMSEPEHGLQRLRRAGIEFSEQEKQNIIALQNSGRIAESQTAFLEALASKGYGGLAQEMTNTFGGALDQLHNQLGAVSGMFGSLLIPSIRPVIGVFKDISSWILGNKSSWMGWAEIIGGAVQRVVDACKNVGAAIGRVVSRVIGDIVPSSGQWEDAFSGVVDVVVSVIDSIAGFIDANQGAIASVVEFVATAGGLIDWGLAVDTITVAAKNLGLTWEIVKTQIALKLVEIGDGFADLWTGLKAGMAGAWAAIVAGVKSMADNILDILKGLVMANAAFGDAIVAGMKAAMKGENPLTAALDTFTKQLNDAFKTSKLTEVGDAMGKAFTEGFEKALDGVEVGDSNLAKQLRKELEDLKARFGGLLDQQRNIARGELQLIGGEGGVSPTDYTMGKGKIEISDPKEWWTKMQTSLMGGNTGEVRAERQADNIQRMRDLMEQQAREPPRPPIIITPKAVLS